MNSIQVVSTKVCHDKNVHKTAKRAPESAEINCNEIQISSEINKQQLSSHDLALCHLVFACFDKTLVEIQKQG